MKQTILKTIQKSTKQPSFSKNSIQRITPNFSEYSSCNKNYFIKKMSLLFVLHKEQRDCNGSMTVEAALAVPLFLFFLLNLIGIIEIYGLHGTLTASLREVGRELSVYAYAYDRLIDGDEDEGLEALAENVAFSYLYVKEKVEEFAGETYLENSPLTYGIAGLSYLESSILQQDDIIDIIVTYQASPFIAVAGFSSARFYNRYYGRAWTGYDVAGGEATEEVYVAENAQVYHIDRECTHLTLSVRECTPSQIENLKNADGNFYRACVLCATEKQTVLYITDRGDCYHGQLNCSGLKRTVFVMKKTEAEKNLKPCTRCGR